MNRSRKTKSSYSHQSTDIVKQGYVKMKSRKMGIWKTYWVVLRKPSSRGTLRLEKYISEKEFSQRDTDDVKKIIPLHSISSVELLSSDSGRHCLTIWYSTCAKSDTGINISTDSEYEILSWCDVLQDAQQLYGKQYEEFIAEDKFHVLLLPGPLLPFSGEYILHVSGGCIKVIDTKSDDVTSTCVTPSVSPEQRTESIVTWPLTALRKYGRDDNKFTIESGRSCTTGEGLYIFHSYQAEQIYQVVHRASLHMASSYTNDYNKRFSTWSNSSASSDSGGDPFIQRRQTLQGKSQQKPEKERKSSGVSLFRRASAKDRRPLPPLPSIEDLEISRH